MVARGKSIIFAVSIRNDLDGMRRYLTLIFVWIALIAPAKSNLKVVAGDNDEPLSGATVFSKTGIIIGMTDKNGNIAVPSVNDYPLTVRCLGYEPAKCSNDQAEVKLSNIPFTLQEVVVTPVDRPVERIVCYFREYITGVVDADTLMYYNEHIGDFMLTTRDKVKGFKSKNSPRFMRSRLYARMANADGLDSIFRPKYRDDTFAWEGLIGIPRGKIKITERMANGAGVDTIAGKHGVKSILRRPSKSSYIVQTDFLADHKSHSMSPFIFKLLGMTIDFTECQGSWIYQSTKPTTEFRPADIQCSTFSMSVLGKGKWLKKMFKTDSEVQMYCFYEIYPIRVDYLTVEEAKELWNNTPPREEWVVSPYARPLYPAIQRLVDQSSNH